MVVFAFILILSRWRKWPQGIVFLAYIALYSLGRYSLEFLRGDGERYLLHWTSAQWTSIGSTRPMQLGMGRVILL